MRIPLTKYGWPQVIVYQALITGAMCAYAVLALCCFPDWAKGTPWALLTFWSIELALLTLLVWALMFFRDPARNGPQDENLFVAPADGKVTNIDQLPENEFVAGPTLRVGIFLNILNVHINRAPCSATVEKIIYRRGRYMNAMNPLSGKLNESNTLIMVRTGEPMDRIVVRQVSGAIARRIVCEAKERDELSQGQVFGMIKFGSRTELYVPAGEHIECLVRIGDNVKAGVTPLLRYRECNDSDRERNGTKDDS